MGFPTSRIRCLAYAGLTGGTYGASAPFSPQALHHRYRGPFGKVVNEF
ncbi:hypothetical protein [Rhizobium sp. R634]|nr:hypothetical protein [Rhizobium sp. R634]